MELDDLKFRKAVKLYNWRVNTQEGVILAELVNENDTVVGTIMSCPDVHGSGNYAAYIGSKLLLRVLPLESAVITVETLTSVKGVQTQHIFRTSYYD